MSEEHDVRNLLMTKESRVPTIGAYALTLLLMVVTFGDILGDLQATTEFTSSTPDWQLTFENRIKPCRPLKLSRTMKRGTWCLTCLKSTFQKAS